MSIIGAVYGAVLVNWAKSSLSESFPELWLFALGGLFIGVVMAFPNGLAGLYNTYAAPKIDQWIEHLKSPKKNRIESNKVTDVEKPFFKSDAKVIKSESNGNSIPPLNQGVLHE